MSPNCVRYAGLLDAAEQGAQVITASRRLARDLRSRFDERQLAAGSKAWRTPSILHMDAWLTRLADERSTQAEIPRRLGSIASDLLWDDCFLHELPAGVPNPTGLARQALVAWKRIREWCVPLDELAKLASSRDERIFAAAARAFEARMQAENWIDPGSLRQQASGWIAGAGSAPPGPCVFAGFDRPGPATERLIAAVEDRGARVSPPRITEEASAASLAVFDTEDAEYRAAGAWARKHLARNPDARIAIVCPALETNAATIADHVRDGLVPGWQFGPEKHRASVNLSYGRKLSEIPAVNVALLILRWPCFGLTTREISVLLRSRSMAGSDFSARVRLERALRQLPDRSWTPDEMLAAFAERVSTPELTGFAQAVSHLAELSAAASHPMPPTVCMQKIADVLQQVGWPGVERPTSVEFQLINRWRELLNDLAAAGQVIPAMTMRNAVRYIGRLAGDTLWQPETDFGGKVQVLGALEAAGMEFDRMWISGMDTTQWPPKRAPSPFVPRAIQQQYGMPDATPADTLAYSRDTLQRLRATAGSCVISWSRTGVDGEVSASQLLQAIPTVPLPDAPDPGRFAASIAGNNILDTGPDPAPAVSVDERIRGGAYTVQRQFKEPFSAFVFGRLGVRPLEAIPSGFSAAMRGNMIHDTLHNFLAGLPDRREMDGWSQVECEQRIGSAVDSALAAYRTGLDEPGLEILRLERERLRRLLFRFLAKELQRDAFAVHEVEYRTEYQYTTVKLGIRIDRIDELPDGRLLVIDYKTGLPKHFADRHNNLADMQLVVYAEALDAPIGGLALINIDSREINYRTAGDGWRPDDSWDETLRSWRSQLRETLEAFAAGDVRLDTSQYSADARPLAILSRYEELSRAD